MTQHYKPARKMKSAIIARILAETPPLQRIQNSTRIALACQIDDLIKAKGFSYSQFAKIMGKKPSEISKWTSGAHNFTIDTLQEIAYHLDVSLADLVASTKEEQPIENQIIEVKTEDLQKEIILLKERELKHEKKVATYFKKIAQIDPRFAEIF